MYVLARSYKLTHIFFFFFFNFESISVSVPRLLTSIFFTVSIRGCLERQGLWPPLDREGVGLIYGPL